MCVRKVSFSKSAPLAEFKDRSELQIILMLSSAISGLSVLYLERRDVAKPVPAVGAALFAVGRSGPLCLQFIYVPGLHEA